MLALLRPYRRRLITVAVLMLISAAVDVALPLFQSYAIRAFIEPATLDGLTGFFLVMALAVTVQAVICVIFSRSAFHIEMYFGRDLKRYTFEASSAASRFPTTTKPPSAICWPAS